MSGYIKLHRGWSNSDIFHKTEFCERAAWVWLLETAAWKDTVRRAGKGQAVEVKRGQLHTSHNALASAWGWSAKRVRGFIDRLEKAGNLGAVGDKNGTLITICNYGKYQDEGRSQGAKEGADRAQSGRTQEEGKEGKEENNNGGYAFHGAVVRLTPPHFERWRLAFPSLDLVAQLTSRDAWLSEQDAAVKKKWFNSTAAWLAKKQQETKKQEDKCDEFTGFC